MRINNNIMAMNTHRQYTINTSSVAKSTEKLSSGYRINRAGDDAAGLAISEKMRAQIRGLTMASKNSNDAISLVQTAEGALQESHNILQRMRELAVQSASDTNETTIDRDALNKEFQALIAEIDDTASKTRFNDQNLIDGTFAANITEASSINSAVIAAWANDATTAGAKTVTFSTISTQGAITGVTGTGTVNGTLTAAVTNSGGASITVSYATAADTAANKTDTANGIWTFGYDKSSKSYTMSNGTTGEVLRKAAGDIAKGGTQVLDFGKAGTITLTETGAAALDSDTISGVASGINVEVQGGVTEQVALYQHIASYEGKDVQLQTGMTSLSFGNLSIKLKDALNVDATSNTALLGGSLTIDVAKTKGKDFVVQTGANQFDELSVNINRMDSASLGVSVSSIENRMNASAAITQVNTAINLVSTQRASLGALQNRLGHKIANLDTSAENLQAAESRIRDLDMAKEMTAFTKNNILVQASTAMLAQANAAPQGVLQLLQ